MTRIELSPPHLTGEEGAMLADALASGWIAPLGPHVDAFEAEFAEFVGMPSAAAMASGTAALHVACRLAGVGPGDTVIVPTLTFVATANAVSYLGATPSFVDVSTDTWTIDPDLLATELADRAASGDLPAAVVTVDLYGQSADYDRVMAACDEHGVPVVEDAAEALGATYRGRPVGSFGMSAAFSFNGNKIITTSGGGMLVSEDDDLVGEARHLASQAKVPGSDYLHETIGYNYRLSNLLAAVGRAQLETLPGRVETRRRIFSEYRTALGDLEGLSFMPVADYGEPTHWLSVITVDPETAPTTRQAIRKALAAEDIDSRPLWMPLHRQPMFEDHRVVGGDVADHLFDIGLCLPSGSDLSGADQDRIVDVIRAQWS